MLPPRLRRLFRGLSKPTASAARLAALIALLLTSLGAAVATGTTDAIAAKLGQEHPATAGEQLAEPVIVYSLAPNTTVYDPNLQVIISICPEGTALQSHSVTSSRGDVQSDAYAECPSGGGTAYFVSWHADFNNEMLLGANDVSISACNVQYQCTYPTVYYNYAIPIDPNISTTLLDPLTELKPGQTDTIRVSIANSDTYAKTLSFGNGLKCVGGLGNCAILGDTLMQLPAAVGKNHGRDTLFVRVRGDTLGMGVANMFGCRTVGPPPTQICIRVTQDIPILPPKPVVAGVTVTPGVASTEKGQGASFSLSFTVLNTGSASTKYDLTPVCTASVVASGCPAASTATLGPSASTVITMSSLTATSPGSLTTGVVSLTATGGVASATGQTAVTVGPNGGTGGSPVIELVSRSINSRTSIARDQCLMVAAGDAAGVECGDLRLAHALPSMQTMGKSRAPTLIYSSRDSRPIKLLNANVTVLRATPSSVTTTLTVGGQAVQRSYSWPTSCQNVTCRIVVPFDGEASPYSGWGAFPTGVYPYTLQVEMVVGGTPYTATDTGSFALVNRAFSPFGRGWWLEGLEQIVHVSATEKLWVGGDGSTRLYRRTVADSNRYVVAAEDAVSRPDTLRKHAENEWRRHLPNAAYTRFDNAGQHTHTVDDRNHATWFKYASGRIDSVMLKVPSGSTAKPHYKFFYNPGTGWLDSIWTRRSTLPQRTTRIARNSNPYYIDSIVDPGESVGVHFGFNSAFGQITWRRTRMLDTAFFSFDSLNVVSETKLSMSRTADTAIVTKLCAIETRSLVTCPWMSSPLGGVPLPQAVTKMNGPRTGDIDIMTFHINRFGGPDSLQDPLGGRTRLERSQAFPALVTKVTDAAGQVQRAWYNGRGLVDSLRVENPLGTGAHATTRIRWHSTWSLPDTIKPPVGASTRFGYGYSNYRPHLDWQQVGPDTTTRVRYWYNAVLQVDSVAQLGMRERFSYDATMGNIRRVRANDHVTMITRDSVGAELIVADTLGLLTETIFRNAMGRVDSTLAVSAATSRFIQQTPSGVDSANTVRWNNVPSRGRMVINSYDAEGNLLSVQRKTTQTEHAFATTTTSWSYDAARRVRRRVEAFGTDSFFYDPAGLQTRRKSGRGHVIRQEYDAGGRLVARVIPGVRTAQAYCGSCADAFAPYPPPAYPYFATTLRGGGVTTDFVAPADVEVFSYDIAGRMLTANNGAARISRGYYPGGALKGDTLRIRSWDPTDSLSGQYASHNYGLAYQADIAGRRTVRDDYWGRRQTYSYHDSLGVLTRTTDKLTSGGDSTAFGLKWDAGGRFLKDSLINAPIEISRAQSYLPTNGFLAERIEKGQTPWGAGTVFRDTYAYDSRGRQLARITESPDYALQDTSFMKYDGFGALVAMSRHRSYGTLDLLTDEFDVDALGNVWGSHANRWTNVGRKQLDNTYIGERLNYQNPAPLAHVRGDHPDFPAVLALDTARHAFDASGNQIYKLRHNVEFTHSAHGIDYFALAAAGSEYTFHMYDAAERLRTTVRAQDALFARHTQLDYRYDALGRRIMMRSRTDSTTCTTSGSGNTLPCLSTMDRFVWDGDQLLVELRGPGHWTKTTAELDVGAGTGAFFGQVRYIHALGIDAPLAVRKGSETPFVPHASGRGGYEAGTYADGTEMDEYHWPGRNSGVYLGADARLETLEPMGWFGSLLDGKADASGLQYMRNRYYDPGSGRFTQRDPIGLAGGLNQYGFASSDPINGSDPFGLKVCFKGQNYQELADSTAAATKTTFDLEYDAAGNQWCAINVKSVAPLGFFWDQVFIRMVRDQTFTYPVVGVTGNPNGPAGSGNTTAGIIIDFSDTQKNYPQNPIGGICHPGPEKWSLTAIIGHELGHAFATQNGYPANNRATAAMNRTFAIEWENAANRSHGKPPRPNLAICH